MKITSKGQITIPQRIREEYGFLPETQVAFEVRDGGEIVLVKEKREKSRVRRGIERTKGLLAHLGMTTDELMELTRGED
jgi:AbrB family looped-hinge helix DNA binding protein